MTELEKISDQELKRIIAQRLFDEIKHGDQEHRAWLKSKIEEFFKTEIQE